LKKKVCKFVVKYIPLQISPICSEQKPCSVLKTLKNLNKTNHAIRWIVSYPVDSLLSSLSTTRACTLIMKMLLVERRLTLYDLSWETP